MIKDVAVAAARPRLTSFRNTVNRRAKRTSRGATSLITSSKTSANAPPTNRSRPCSWPPASASCWASCLGELARSPLVTHVELISPYRTPSLRFDNPRVGYRIPPDSNDPRIYPERHIDMAEETDPGQAAAGQQQVQVLVDEREMKTLYANAYRIHTAEQEAVIDFGFNMPNPNSQPGQQQQVLLKVTDRVVISYVTAKRLALSLQQLVKRFEQQFGEIPVMPGQRK